MKFTIKKQTTEQNEIDIENGCYMLKGAFFTALTSVSEKYIEEYILIHNNNGVTERFAHTFHLPNELGYYSQQTVLSGMQISSAEYYREASKMICQWNGSSEEVAA